MKESSNQILDFKQPSCRCLLMNGTVAVSWHQAQAYCKSMAGGSSHLVEIFNQEQQDYMTSMAYQAEALTGRERDWWIGMTDDNSEGR